MTCFGHDGAPIPCSGWVAGSPPHSNYRYQLVTIDLWLLVIVLAMLVGLPALATRAWRRRLGVRGGLLAQLGLCQRGSRGGAYAELGESVGQPATTSPPRRPPQHHSSPLRRSAIRIASSTSSFFLRSTPFLRHLSLGSLSLLLFIPLSVLFGLFSQSNILSNANRPGFIALGLGPPLFLLAMKSGPVPYLLQYSWTVYNFLHRWLGRAILFCGIFHGCLWIVAESNGNIASYLTGRRQWTGFLLLSSLILIGVTSLPFVRRRAYSFFYGMHLVGVAMYLVMGDLLIRAVSFRIKRVKVEACDGQGMVKVTVLGVNQGWSGGQHLYLRLFRPSLVRPLALFQSHPFSLATSSSSQNPTLYVRTLHAGSWTSLLSSSSPSTTRWAWLEGPFGPPSLDLEHGKLLLVAGGSGMAYILGVLQEEMLLRRDGRVEVVWCVREGEHVGWFSNELLTIQQEGKRRGVEVIVQVFVTGEGATADDGLATDPEPLASSEEDNDDGEVAGLLASASTPVLDKPEPVNDPDSTTPSRTRLHFIRRRPDLSSLLKDVVDGMIVEDRMDMESGGLLEEVKATTDEEDEYDMVVIRGGEDEIERDERVAVKAREPTGLAVVVCGPGRMLSDVRNAVASVDVTQKVRIGGIKFVGEHFGV